MSGEFEPKISRGGGDRTRRNEKGQQSRDGTQSSPSSGHASLRRLSFAEGEKAMTPRDDGRQAAGDREGGGGIGLGRLAGGAMQRREESEDERGAREVSRPAVRRVRSGYDYVQDSMAELREQFERERGPLRTLAQAALLELHDAGHMVISQTVEWVDADGKALLEGLAPRYSPDIGGVLEIAGGQLFGVPIGDAASMFLSEIRGAFGALDNPVKRSTAAFSNLTSLASESQLVSIGSIILGTGSAFEVLGELEGRMNALALGGTSKAAESEADSRNGLAERFGELEAGGHELEGERAADFDAHVGLEVAQADAKARELMELTQQYRMQVVAMQVAAATFKAKGLAALSRAKDKYLQHLTRDATEEKPPHPNRPGPPEHKAAVVVQIELTHVPGVRDALNDPGSEPEGGGGFMIARMRSRIESDTKSSKVMDSHVKGMSLSELKRLGLPVRVEMQPSHVVYEVDKTGEAKRKGDSGYYARFSYGLIEGDPALQRRDLGRRSPERGDRVLEAVMGLLRERPIGSLEKHVVRSL